MEETISGLPIPRFPKERTGMVSRRKADPKGRPKFAIPDGFGPASQAFARDYSQYVNQKAGKGWNKVLPADEHLIGSLRTRASNTLVTDSSASGTAYSCAIKTYNGAVAIGEDGNPCGTVLEAAKAQGFHTGLVVTSRITHATPAVFYSHIYDRDAEDKIAEMLVGNTPLGPVVDVALGGGLAFFLPNTTDGSDRTDSRDILAEGRKFGYHTFTDRAGFDALNGGDAPAGKKPYIGVFTASHMSYEIDRDPEKEPSLLEMTKTALKSLERMTAGKDKGFFIMVEASRIDHAGHGNDMVGHLHEILMYNQVIDYLKQYVDSGKAGETILISHADHECGGLTMGGIATNGEYLWEPEKLTKSKHSASFLGSLWAKYDGDDGDNYLNGLFEQYGIFDANATEIAVAQSIKNSTSLLEYHFGQSMEKRALVRWATLGHTAVDINLLGYARSHADSNLDVLRGNHDNTEAGLFVANQLGLDLPAITKKLNSKVNEKWLVNEVGRDLVDNGVVTESKRKLVRRAHGHDHTHA
ncbi:alkaline phosphatase-like protein [Atractiella rhizophila]|nr:alkaline phosphatase-like protein [Atractiella rhizophila]